VFAGNARGARAMRTGAFATFAAISSARDCSIRASTAF
jgi:hypothetical protein